jgi:uncharacterized protein (TIGR00297 family)
VLGVVLALAVAFVAHRAKALSLSGAIAAFAIGAITLDVGGWNAAAVLFAFFLPSTILSRIGRARKRELTDVGKQGARDAWQVLANGGIATLCLLAAQKAGAPLAAGFAAAFAAAASDTWGTEIGTLVRTQPRSMLTLRPIPTGISGGITLAGTLAEIAGAAAVALVASLLHVAPFLPVLIGGFAGAMIDSLMGASLQSLRYCPRCDRICETDPHACGTQTTVRRGFKWLGNDAVNLVATICGAAIGALVSLR